MNGPGYTVLPKSEWERLRKQAGLLETTDDANPERDLYIKALNEKSQEKIRKWPDSLQAVVDKVAKRKQQREEKHLKMVSEHQELQEVNKEAQSNIMNKAKQRIFDSSGYGQQLISALIESRTLEERDVQMKFQKEIKQKELELEERLDAKGMTLDLGHDYEADEIARKNQIKEVQKLNKDIHKMMLEKKAKEKEEEKLLELEENRIILQLLQFEEHAMDHCKEAKKQMAKDFEDDQRKFRAARAEREKIDEDISRVWSEYHDIVQCKERETMERVHKNKNDQNHFKANYALTEKLQAETRKRYEDFINKGLEKMETELSKKEKDDSEKNKRRKEIILDQAARNKKMAEDQQAMKRCLKWSSSRQSLFTQPRKNSLKIVEGRNNDEGVYHPPPYLPRHHPNTLKQALRAREEQPSPWNGLEASHAYFARQAGDILSQCKHKNMARKVVDEYRKVNCLDSTTLPVSNY